MLSRTNGFFGQNFIFTKLRWSFPGKVISVICGYRPVDLRVLRSPWLPLVDIAWHSCSVYIVPLVLIIGLIPFLCNIFFYTSSCSWATRVHFFHSCGDVTYMVFKPDNQPVCRPFQLILCTQIEHDSSNKTHDSFKQIHWRSSVTSAMYAATDITEANQSTALNATRKPQFNYATPPPFLYDI